MAGWVAGSTRPTPAGTMRESFWFGPDHGWGATFGPPSMGYSIARFRTRREAVAAVQAEFGKPMPSGWRFVRESDVPGLEAGRP